MNGAFVVSKFVCLLLVGCALVLGGCVGFGPCSGQGQCGGVGTCEGDSKCDGSGVCEGTGFCDGIGFCRGTLTCDGIQSVNTYGVPTCDGKGTCEGTGGCEGIGTCQGKSKCEGSGQCFGAGYCDGLGSCWPFGAKPEPTHRTEYRITEQPQQEVVPSGSLTSAYSNESSNKKTPAYTRRSFEGFSIAHQGGDYWIVIKKDRAGIDLLRQADPNNKRHTFVAFATSTKSSSDMTLSKLRTEVERIETSAQSHKRYSNYKYELSTKRVDDAECIKSNISTDDHGVPYDLGTHYYMTGFTLYCLHPETSKRTIVLGYSERRQIGSKSLMQASEIQEFVGGLRFEPLIR